MFELSIRNLNAIDVNGFGSLLLKSINNSLSFLCLNERKNMNLLKDVFGVQ